MHAPRAPKQEQGMVGQEEPRDPWCPWRGVPHVTISTTILAPGTELDNQLKIQSTRHQHRSKSYKSLVKIQMLMSGL